MKSQELKLSNNNNISWTLLFQYITVKLNERKKLDKYHGPPLTTVGTLGGWCFECQKYKC